MKRLTATVILMLGLASYGQVRRENGKHSVLPNTKLLRCVASRCSQIWQDKPPGVNDVYPKQVVFDLLGNNPCPLGVLARYDKSVSMGDLKAAIDERCGKWALPSNATAPVKLWRVEPGKFAIQLSEVDKQKLKVEEAEVEVEAKTVTYMAFQPAKCGVPITRQRAR